MTASTVLLSILFSLCGLLTLALLRSYLPLRSTPYFILFPVFLAIAIPFSIVFLVPIDLASSSVAPDSNPRGIVLGGRTLLVLWRISYWLCFVLTWAILPILQSYSDSGHHTPRKRLIQSLHENARYQLIVLAIGLAGLIYFIINSGFHFYSLKALVIALSHCYALTLAIYLMGHSLVAIPRHLFRDASIPAKLMSLQLKAPKAYDNLVEATQAVKAVEAEIVVLRRKKNGIVEEFQNWIDELVDISGLPETTIPGHHHDSTPVPQVITEQYLADVTRRLRAGMHNRARYLSEWASLVQEAANAQAILDSAASKKLTFPSIKSKSASLLPASFSVLTPYTRYIVFLYIIPQIKRLCAIVLSLASVSIIWSELVHGTFPKLSIVGQSIIHHRGSEKGEIGFAGQALAAAWIGYMCACTFNSMKNVKIWGGYALVPRATSGGSACLYASYACRLTVPLSFNFLGFIPSDAARNSVFNEFLGKNINFTPLGAGFDSFFPMFILFPVVATLFNLYGKIKDYLGFGIDVLEGDDDQEQGGWLRREGRDLIEREISGYTRGIESPNGSEISIGRTGSRTWQQTRTPELGSFDGGRTSPLPLSVRNRSQQQFNARIDDDSADTGDDRLAGMEGFLHRVRNTWEIATEGVTRPAWLRSGRMNSEQPRWVRNAEAARPESPGMGWGRIFGSAGAG